MKRTARNWWIPPTLFTVIPVILFIVLAANCLDNLPRATTGLIVVAMVLCLAYTPILWNIVTGYKPYKKQQFCMRHRFYHDDACPYCEKEGP